jgi:hypothetical protein
LFVNVSSTVITLEYCFYLTLNSNQSIYLFKAKYKTCPVMLSVYTLYPRFSDFVYLSRIMLNLFATRQDEIYRIHVLIPILCKDLNWQEMHSLRIQLMLSIFLKCRKKWWKMLQNICNKSRFPWQPAQIFRVWKIVKKNHIPLKESSAVKTILSSKVAMETGICYKYFATFSIISYDTLKK